MKIAIVVNTSWNIYNFRMGLIEAFLEKGHEVIAIAPTDNYSSLLKEKGCKFHPIKMENKGSNPLKDFSLFLDLYKVYKKVKPDIILQYTIKPNIYGTLAAGRLGIPVINNVSGLGTTFIHNNLVSKIAHLLYRFSFRFADKVFFQNKDDLQLFLEKKLVSKNKTGILPGSGVKVEKYFPGEFQKNDPLLFLMIARLLYDKGVIEYIEAIKLIRKEGLAARFQIMGAMDEESNLGIPKSDLENWVKEKWIEYIPFQKDVLPFLSKADCIVLPSYREGTPKTLLEAAAMGKPLIATDVPGCREVVENEKNGFLCKAKNPVDLASKIKTVIQLPEEKLKMLGQKSREKVLSEFDEKFVVKTYIDTIIQLIANKKH